LKHWVVHGGGHPRRARTGGLNEPRQPARACADKNSRRVTIGVAFTHKDASESVLLHAWLVNGRWRLRSPRAKAKKADVEEAMKGHVLEEATLMGKYQR